MTSLGNFSSMKKKLRRLGLPYKHTKAYQICGEKNYCNPNERHFEKYERAKFQSEKKQIVIAADNVETLEEMLKYWEGKGYEIASPRYSDHTDALKLFYWQRVQKKQ